MALDRVPLTPEQAEEIDNLRRLGQFTEDVWHTLFIQEGLHGLRLRAAAVLYRTRPLTISAVADQVHLSRGELIDWFHTQGIAPWIDPAEEADVSAHWDAWIQQIRSHS